MDGVGARHAPGMGEDRGPGDQQRHQPGAQEVKRVERDAIGEALQPAMQVIPGDGPGDQVGGQNGNGELPQQQEHHIADAGAEHLADADFLGAAARGESGQTEQAHAGNDNGDGDKDREHLPLFLVGAVKPLEAVIQETVRHGDIGQEGVRGPLDKGHRFGGVAGLDADGEGLRLVGGIDIDHRAGGGARAFDQGVGRDPDHLHARLAEDEGPVQDR